MLLPNVYIHPLFGKMLFSFMDLVLGYLIYRILEMRRVNSSISSLCATVWVFNPLPIVVSTRGNAESVLSCMVVGVIYLLMKKQNVLAATLFAVAVHFKVYPMIYAPSIYLLVNEQYGQAYTHPKQTKFKRIVNLLWPSDIALVFATIGLSVTVGLCMLFYNMYGQVFLDETYLYHITRKDTQHNFSIYFYPLRIAEQLEPVLSTMVGLSAFLPQLGATLAFTYKYYRDLPFCWFMITFAFVTFNKVCTSQYFLWYLCLLPFVLPGLRLSISEGSIMFAFWLMAQGVWFAPAYYYEYHNYDILGWVWAASLLFFWLNVWAMWKLLKSYRYSPLLTAHTEVKHQNVTWSFLSRKSE
ncbi:GPI mannosyltransferase 1-like [Watersipora subatra]|uniref:GPI mannosyltransferase 1-like n=1 Tax=Watersipora subatra TaxID=2589382 RepID=UPI00355BB9D5